MLSYHCSLYASFMWYWLGIETRASCMLCKHSSYCTINYIFLSFDKLKQTWRLKDSGLNFAALGMNQLILASLISFYLFHCIFKWIRPLLFYESIPQNCFLKGVIGQSIITRPWASAITQELPMSESSQGVRKCNSVLNSRIMIKSIPTYKKKDCLAHNYRGHNPQLTYQWPVVHSSSS